MEVGLGNKFEGKFLPLQTSTLRNTRFSRLIRAQAKRYVFHNVSVAGCRPTKYNNKASSDVGLHAHVLPLDERPRTLKVHCAVWGQHFGGEGAICRAFLVAQGVTQNGISRNVFGRDI
jgi:hypothetical protein